LTEAKLHLKVEHSADDLLIATLLTAARQYCEGFQGRCYMATTYQLKMCDWPADIFELPSAPLWSIGSITYVDTASATQTLSTSVYSVDTTSEPGKIYLAYGQNWPSTRGEHQDITINYNAGYSSDFTANATTDVCTCAGRVFTSGQRVRLRNADGALPTGLAEATDYYVRDVSGNTFKLAATSGGTAIDITGAGTGTHYVGLVPEYIIAAIKLLLGHLYENREATTEKSFSELPLAVKNLLWMNRIVSI
jgi:uncharacterized phiE125 gp8 family phage protein